MVKAIATPAAGSSRKREANGRAPTAAAHPANPRRRAPTARQIAARQRRSAEAAALREIRARTPIKVPFVVCYDQQEGIPYRFTGLKADSDNEYRPLEIETVKVYLKTADYSIVGLEDRIVVERKSLADAYGSLGKHGRERFEREHERMAAIVAAGGWACVVVEASLREALLNPPEFTGVSPKSFDRTRLSWMQKYNVPWLFEDGRRRAEVTTFRLLETFWRHQAEKDQKRFQELF